MKQLKPYLFWIIAGAILLAELIVVLTIEPLDSTGTRTASQVKRALDSEYKHLKELTQRASARSPTIVYDAENAEHIKELDTRFLLTPKWIETLKPQVDKYGQQLQNIRDFLAKRSAVLRRPVVDTRDKLTWYTGYENATADQVARLIEAGALVPPPLRPEQPGVAGAAPAPTGPPTPEEQRAQYKTNADLRAMAGFFTKLDDYPDPDRDWPELTIRYRIMDQLINALLTVHADTVTNPVVGGLDIASIAKSGLPAQLVRVEWKDMKGSEPFAPPMKDLADYVQVTIGLSGPLPALTAATAALEKNLEGDRPISVVVGANLQRKESFASRERLDTSYETAVATLDLVVLDFTKIVSLPTAAAGAVTASIGGAK